MSVVKNISIKKTEKEIGYLMHIAFEKYYIGITKSEFIRSMIIDEIEGHCSIVAEIGFKYLKDYELTTRLIACSCNDNDKILSWLEDNKLSFNLETKRIIKKRIKITDKDEVTLNWDTIEQLRSYISQQTATPYNASKTLQNKTCEDISVENKKSLKKPSSAVKEETEEKSIISTNNNSSTSSEDDLFLNAMKNMAVGGFK